MKRFVTRSSVSAMRSSITTMLRLLASKEVGSPSSSKLFRNISRAGQNRVAGRTWPAGRVLHMVVVGRPDPLGGHASLAGW